MSPARKPPRPVTAWFRPDDLQRLSRDVDAETAIEAFATGTGSEIRCRVTPIRKPTDAEIERLARQFALQMWAEPWDDLGPLSREMAYKAARWSFSKGARP